MIKIVRYGYRIINEAGEIVRSGEVDMEVSVQGSLVSRRFLQSITINSGETLQCYFLPPGYSPIPGPLDPDPQCDPPPPRRAGPDITARCYHCKTKQACDMDLLKSAGWTDLEKDYSSPASDPTYLGVCPAENCRRKT